jgi:hypothetical protein
VLALSGSHLALLLLVMSSEQASAATTRLLDDLQALCDQPASASAVAAEPESEGKEGKEGKEAKDEDKGTRAALALSLVDQLRRALLSRAQYLECTRPGLPAIDIKDVPLGTHGPTFPFAPVCSAVC